MTGGDSPQQVSGVAPSQPVASATAATPSSPTLPPSKGKGEWAHVSITPQAAGQAKRLRRTTTASERRLWAKLRKLPTGFRRQTPIGRYIVDFVSHSAKLIIEVDSARHDLPDARMHDAERDTWLESAGYRVIRIRDTRAYEDAQAVAEEIATLLPRREKGSDEGARAALTGEAREAPPLTADDR